MKSGNYNSRKIRTLEVLSNDEWRDVPTIAHFAGIAPTRRAYAYLAHLAQFGLIVPGEDGYVRRYYRITERGQDRLAWLRSHTAPRQIKEAVNKILRTVIG